MGPFTRDYRKEFLGNVRTKKKERKWDIKCCLDINSVYQNDLSRFKGPQNTSTFLIIELIF